MAKHPPNHKKKPSFGMKSMYIGLSSMFLLIFLLISSVIHYNFTKSKVGFYITTVNNNYLMQQSANVDMLIAEQAEYMDFLAQSKLSTLLSDYTTLFDKYYDKVNKVKEINTYLIQVRNSSPSIQFIDVIINDYTFTSEYAKEVRRPHNYKAITSELSQLAIPSSGGAWFLPQGKWDDGFFERTRYVKEIPLDDGSVGYIVFQMADSWWKSMIQNDTGETILFYEMEDMLFHTLGANESQLQNLLLPIQDESGSFFTETKEGNYSLTYNQLKSTPYKIVAIQDTTNLFAPLQQMRNYVLIGVLLSLIFSIVFFTFYTRQKLIDLQNLKSAAREYVEKNTSSILQIKYRTRSLREETTISFFLIIFLPLVLFHCFFSFFAADVIDVSMKRMVTVSFEQRVAQWENMINRNNHISQLIMFQHEIQQILFYQEENTSQQLGITIKNYSTSHQLKGIDFYDNTGNLLYTSRLDASTIPATVDNAVKESYGESILVSTQSYGAQSNEIRFLRKIKMIYPSISEEMATIGYIATSYFLDEHYNNSSITDNGQFAIMENGEPLYNYFGSDLPDIFTKEISHHSAENRTTPDGVTYYSLTRSLENNGKIAIYVIPADDLDQDISTLFSITLNILFGLCVAAFLISHFFSSYISRPVHKLIENLLTLDAKETNQGEPFYPHELNELTYAFNKMAGSLKEVYELENAKSLAELQALQAQINPHFMYNTFEAIRWMNKGGETEKVEEMIALLSDLFRFGINVERNIISLGEEIEHAEAYLGIQKMRYGDELQYSFVVDPETLHCMIPKLILQPLLENSIYHGIRELEDQQGFLWVDCTRHGDILQIVVADNGKGFSEEKKMAFQQLIKHPHRTEWEHIGLINVYRRLEYIYQDRFSFSIDSCPASSHVGISNRGTQITISVPFRLNESSFESKML